ncbi:keratin-associated protein 6-2-like isoform X3 [Corticium candelabrum]|uniref:keratin-associated protein 6-2-like isoform X3 n=1 Tax=Corticium candelabrum TaxID=121492 RepID=UPI002E2688B1|nr:keratin-associated protein 6-2-like isoform X3 [Corticium candelabrum]
MINVDDLNMPATLQTVIPTTLILETLKDKDKGNRRILDRCNSQWYILGYLFGRRCSGYGYSYGPGYGSGYGFDSGYGYGSGYGHGSGYGYGRRSGGWSSGLGSSWRSGSKGSSFGRLSRSSDSSRSRSTSGFGGTSRC